MINISEIVKNLKSIYTRGDRNKLNKLKEKCGDDLFINFNSRLMDNTLKFNKLYESIVLNYKTVKFEISEEKYEEDTIQYYEDIYRQIYYKMYERYLDLYNANYSSKHEKNKELISILTKNKIKNFPELIIMLTYLELNINKLTFSEITYLFKDIVKSMLGSYIVHFPEFFVSKDCREFSKYVVDGMIKQDNVKELFS